MFTHKITSLYPNYRCNRYYNQNTKITARVTMAKLG